MKPPRRRRRTAPREKLTRADQGKALFGEYARTLYGGEARSALLSLALMEAMFAEAAAIADPQERQAVLNMIHVRAYEAAHGPPS